LQEVTQWLIGPRNPQFDAAPLQVRISVSSASAAVESKSLIASASRTTHFNPARR